MICSKVRDQRNSKHAVHFKSANQRFATVARQGWVFEAQRSRSVDWLGYSFVNINRKTKSGGGVGMFICSAFTYRVRNDLNLQKDDILESIFIETCRKENDKIIIGTIYSRPPTNNCNDFETELKQSFTQWITKTIKTCILMDDFNIDLLKYGSNEHANRFLNQMYSSQFYPVIIRPTRITTNSATIIDNIFINNIYLDRSSGILINDLSDHLPVVQISPNLNIQKPKKNSFKRRELTKANIYKLRIEIQNISWEYLKTINDVDDAYSYFQEKFLRLYNTCIPNKNYSNKESKTSNKPWITKGFIKSSRIKNMLYKKRLSNGNEEMKAKYKYYCNRLNKLKIILKKKYYERQFDTTKGNIEHTWKLVNDVLNRKKKETVHVTEFKKDQIMNQLLTGRKLVTDSMIILLTLDRTLLRR